MDKQEYDIAFDTIRNRGIGAVFLLRIRGNSPRKCQVYEILNDNRFRYKIIEHPRKSYIGSKCVHDRRSYPSAIDYLKLYNPNSVKNFLTNLKSGV